jgi:uncharacterized damage-inducible protein DinB
MREEGMEEAVRRLFDHLAWADQAVLENLRRNAPAPEKALAYFAHVLAAEELWIQRIEGRSPVAVAVWPKLTLAECASLAQANARALGRIVEEGGWERGVTYARSTGETYTSSVGDILLHLATHGCYHRGQVAAVVRGSGGEPVNTDYIHHVRTR